MHAEPPLLAVRDLCIGFRAEGGRVGVVEGVSFEVGRQEIVSIVGESGSGKSATALTILGLTRAPNTFFEGVVLYKGDNLLLTTTGLPADLEQYILFSQMAQAEGLMFGIEHYRRRKPHCSGELVWQLDDCWPVLSWSVLDYYGFPKASYYYLKRVYAPVLASFKSASDGTLELWLTNDTQFPVTEHGTVRLGTFDGQTLWEQSQQLAVAAGASACASGLEPEARGRQM